MENDHMVQSKTSSRTRIPTVGLKEMNPASTNARSGLVQPGTIAGAVISKNSGLPQPGRPRSTTQSGAATSTSRTASSTTKTHGRANTYSSNTLGRSASTVSRTKSTISSTTGPTTRPHTSMSRSHTVTNSRRPMANAIPRAATAMGSREQEDSEGTILGKRKGGEWDQDLRERRMYDLVRSVEERVSQHGQSNSVLKDALDLYKSRVSELEASSKELTETNVTLRVEMGLMGNRLAAAEKALKDAQRDHEIVVDDLNARRCIETETARLESRKEMEAIYSRHQEEIHELKRRFANEIEGERAARLRELNQIASQSALDTQRSNVELDKKEREIASQQHEINTLKADLERERKNNRDLRHNLDTASTNTVTMESSVRALKARIEFLESGREEQSQAFERLNQQMMDALAETNATKEKLRKEETLRRKLHNQVQELKGNIRVFCRVRPSLPSDPVTQVAQIQYPDEAEDCKEIAVLGPEEKSSLGSISRKNSNFSFDRVFRPSTQNAEVFDEISQLVQSALDGYNVCIFCYGQTGSGKTYTMSSLDGMIPRAVHQIYETAMGLEEKGWRYTMEGNFVEVYNENLNDLLGNPDDLDKKKLEIRHDMQRGKTIITDVTTVRLESPEMVETILKRAAANRSVAATKANERSSRSHSVFILKLIGENDITGERSEGTLNLVDLAGSERLSHSGATGERLRETQNINRSLSCLGDVIAALGQGKEGGHIPYRNSKLTYLLQFSLGGNSKTLMFVMVSPLQAHLAETLTSLKFATKVHNTHIGTAKRQARVREC
ncbi:putative kinesin family protein (KlpA) [Aspergillus homomorphus CBS 101889]|uniref:Kinesin-like protein n=1 Tax=Aspergillus homomorphus (strain CBS 101889) TaxID=1450537 RepID=A0A395I2C3_ASPHC|nr:kinesin-domain-containing protein [Aspergillus homomorphus CBS 101889]RAL13866.1 kinesin-domain-containing protein [Aspergillus homomorphus CBS 101889]